MIVEQLWFYLFIWYAGICFKVPGVSMLKIFYSILWFHGSKSHSMDALRVICVGFAYNVFSICEHFYNYV